MAKQKKLNKNLVAFLTVMGMLLIVSLVGVVVWQRANRDPQVYGDMAQKAQTAGDLGEAARQFNRAWRASQDHGTPDPEYLLQAADCLLSMGEIAQWRGMLVAACSQFPAESRFRTALLLGLWRLRDIRGQLILENEWRDHGKELATLDPNSTLGPASAAFGLWTIGGEAERREADDFAQSVYQRDPRDPYAALAYQAYLLGVLRDDLNAAQARNAPAQEIAALRTKWFQACREVFEPALQEHPGHSVLCNTYANLLHSEANDLGAREPAQAKYLREIALNALTTAIEQNAEETRPELYVNRAQVRLAILEADRLPITRERAKEVAPEVAEIDGDLLKALELDNALYEAHRLRGELARIYSVPSEADQAEIDALKGSQPELQWRLRKVLDIYEAARQSTQTLRTLRAQLNEINRLLFIRRGFDYALTLDALESGNATTLKTAPRAELFLADAQTKASESPITAFMEGQLYAARGDLDAATGRFELAHQRTQLETATQRFGSAYFWRGVIGAPTTPAERLATLQLQRRQYGEAERWSAEALESYTRGRETPPLDLLAVRAEVLLTLNRSQEALDLLNEYRAQYADNRQLEALRASALTRLGRADEAQQSIARVTAAGGGGDDIRGELWRAQRALELKDYATAEEAYQGIVANAASSDAQVSDALQRWLLVIEQSRGRAAARELLKTWVQQPPRPALQRLLDVLELEFNIENPDQITPQERADLDARQLEIVQSTTQPTARAQGLYQYYVAREKWAEALEQLDELRRQLPDELRIVEEQFRIYLRQENLSRAAELLPLLAQADEGRGLDLAGGAVYRGDLAMSQKPIQTDVAIREYRQAVNQAPKSAELQCKLGRAYLVANRLPEAVEALNRAVEYNPRSFQGWYLLRAAQVTLAAQAHGGAKSEHEELARQAEARAVELNPNHPEVREWAEIAAEDRDPQAAIAKREQRRRNDPQDERNALRLASLYLRAWDNAVAAQDTTRQQELAAAAEPFFTETLGALQGEAQVRFMPAVATWYALISQGAAGEALLRNVTQAQSDEARLQAQLHVAAFLEMVGSIDAAEREYQQAQQLVRELTSQSPNPELVMRVGRALVEFQQRAGRLDKVVEACRWLLDRLGTEGASQSLPVRVNLIETLVRANKYTDAEREIAEFIRLYPDDPMGLQLRAQFLATRGKREEAIAEFGRVLQKQPDNLVARYGRGRLLLQRGQYDKAAEDLEQALELVDALPNSEPEIRELLASLYGQWRKFDLAATELRRLLDLQEARGAPSERKQATMRRLARVMYVGLNQFDQAQKLISEYMEKNPDESVWAFELGRLFENRAIVARDDARRAGERGDTTRQRERSEAARQDYASAANYYQRAADRAGAADPQNRTIASLAQLSALNSANRAADVRQLCARVPLDGLDAPQAAEARARIRAEFALAHGQTPEGAQLWQQTLLEAANVHVAIAGELAQRLPEVFAVEDGLAVLRAAAQAAPPNSPAALRLRLILASQTARARKFEDALREVDEVIKQALPGSPERMSGLLTRAQALELTGDTAGSVQAYKEIVQAYQQGMPPAGIDYLRTALNNLAYSLATADPPVNAPAEARSYVERLQALMGPNEATPTMLDTVGWVYYKNGELAAAAAALEEAISLGGPAVAPALHLAEVYRAQKRDSEARDILNRALQAARDNGRTDEIGQLETRLKEFQ